MSKRRRVETTTPADLPGQRHAFDEDLPPDAWELEDAQAEEQAMPAEDPPEDDEPAALPIGGAEETAPPAPVITMRAVGAVPLGELPKNGYVPRKVEARLSLAQSVALRRLAVGLDARGERALKPNYREPCRCTTEADAVRWLLERIAE